MFALSSVLKTLRLPLGSTALALALVALGSVAHAQRAMMESSYHSQMMSIRSQVGNVDQNQGCTNCTSSETTSCQAFHDRMSSDGVLDIRVAFGYMDVSEGQPYTYAGWDLGQSPSLDSASGPAFGSALESSCWFSGVKTCGFDRRRDDPEVYEKEIERADGRRVMVRIRLTHASASLSYADNKGPLRAEQTRLTEASERNFFGGLSEADAVLYLGHARNGGGPDFKPVVLRTDGNPSTLDHANYAGHYLVRREGLRRMQESLSGARRASLVGLLACSSDRHFMSSMRRVAPSTAFITTGDKIYYDKILETAFGTVEALVRGSCSAEFRNAIQLSDFARQEVLFRQFPAGVAKQ